MGTLKLFVLMLGSSNNKDYLDFKNKLLCKIILKGSGTFQANTERADLKNSKRDKYKFNHLEPYHAWPLLLLSKAKHTPTHREIT